MESASQEEQQCLSISELTGLLGRVVEEALPHVVFTGEIFQFTRAPSGHLYFTVRDSDSQVSSVMWRGMARGLEFEPESGDQVVCYGKPTVYARGGKLQIVVHRMVPVGDGQLQKKFERLKEKLSKEGLFDEDRKREIPFLPSSIGIVSSKSGAAIHDVMTRIRARMPSQRVYLCDARVQGDGAVEQIVRGIKAFQRPGLVDVIIVTRGGGSLEDLWAFNEEKVVRAIFASKVPVISAVGHEVDVTLSDLVADLRAPTPTAAGEMVVPQRDDLLEKIENLEERLFDLDYWFSPLQQRFDELSYSLEQGVSRLLQEGRLIVDRLEAQVQTLRPDRLMVELQSRIDSLSNRQNVAMQRLLTQRRLDVERHENALRGALPVDRLKMYGDRVAHLKRQLAAGVYRQIENRSIRLRAVSERLSSVSPDRILERGFSLVTYKDKTVREADDLSQGDTLLVRFHKGSVEAGVNKVVKE